MRTRALLVLSLALLSPGARAADVATPVLTLPSGKNQVPEVVIVTAGSPGSRMHYTTSGAEPTDKDPKIASGARAAVTPLQVLKVKAWMKGHTPSATASASGALVARFFAGTFQAPWVKHPPSPWPANWGFDGDPFVQRIPKGMRFSRYGSEYGTYVAPEGTSFNERGLPESSRSLPESLYETEAEIDDVLVGRITEWGSGGGGVQYKFSDSVLSLIQAGKMCRLNLHP
jgi:hypothetical protein